MLFNKRIEPSCAYCKHGACIGEGEVICRKKGVTSSEDACFSFKYDPLRRKPEVRSPIIISELNPEDLLL